MNYLTGSDYPWLCESCQRMVDQAATVISEASDEYASDEEGPCNWVYDRRLFCGGHECLKEYEEEEGIVFRLDDIDRDAMGDPRANEHGWMYGVGVYIGDKLVDRVYAPSEWAAFHNAEKEYA